MRQPYFWKERKRWYFGNKDEAGKLRGMPLEGETKAGAFDHWRSIRDGWAMEDAGEAAASEPELTVADVVRLFSEKLQNRLQLGEIEELTIEQKQYHLASFAAAVDTSVPVTSMKQFHATEWLDGCSSWNATTRHFLAETIKSMFKWALDEDRIDKNPLAKLSLPRREPRDYVVD